MTTVQDDSIRVSPCILNSCQLFRVLKMSNVSLKQHLYEIKRWTTVEGVKIDEKIMLNLFVQHNEKNWRNLRRSGDKVNRVQHRGIRSVKNIDAVSDSVADGIIGCLSFADCGLFLRFSRILRKALQLHRYTIQLSGELKPTDHEQRRIYAWSM